MANGNNPAATAFPTSISPHRRRLALPKAGRRYRSEMWMKHVPANSRQMPTEGRFVAGLPAAPAERLTESVVLKLRGRLYSSTSPANLASTSQKRCETATEWLYTQRFSHFGGPKTTARAGTRANEKDILQWPIRC
ncbi:MAG: hypothetical protein EOR51_02855 [Mesorhizobium sp.]|uniref:hypothetical protein n=2 Tax=Mesorhizobium sp. TaxID=1871066 RepID=UPI000FE6D3D1|nr:hypothetical protein [Mesorhizobium sp.]RWK78511.1 MAG: hypothetical protein EOR50_09215 [Mesorhizobium sp.]RWK84544.1 MAG: hypothetical protein EOR51_02855 [Mesorhizobium sp.]